MAGGFGTVVGIIVIALSVYTAKCANATTKRRLPPLRLLDHLTFVPRRHLAFRDEESGRYYFSNCSDVSALFNWRKRFDGLNILEEFFDCECIGDLNVSFVLQCSVQNHCFFHGSQEICLDSLRNYTIDPVPKGPGAHPYVPRTVSCDTYTKGGPVGGKLCSDTNNSCALTLKDTHGLSTNNATNVCNSLGESCPMHFLALGYSPRDAQAFCPTRTLNGLPCLTFGERSCLPPSTTYEYPGYYWTPDCSNIDPCAVPRCQKRVFNRSSNQFFVVYPECADHRVSDNDDSFQNTSDSNTNGSTEGTLVDTTPSDTTAISPAASSRALHVPISWLTLKMMMASTIILTHLQ